MTRINTESELFKILKENLENSDIILITGNGGSLSSAIHISSDLLKFGFPILDINNPSFLTAIINDYGFKDAFNLFLDNLKAKHKNKNIFLIVLTVHGGKILLEREKRNESNIWSANLYNLVKKANELNIKTLVISGLKNLICNIANYYYLIPAQILDIEAEQVKIFHQFIKIIQNGE